MSSAKLETFLKWATENGVNIDDNISFDYSEKQGYSAIIKDITKYKSICSKEEPLISVPESLFIDPISSKKYFDELYDVKLKTLDNDVENLGEKLLYLYISKLKLDSVGTDFFKPYLNILPSCIRGIPYYYTKSQLGLLKGSDAGIFVKRSLNRLLNDWQQLLTFLSKFDKSIDIKEVKTYVESFSLDNLDLAIEDHDVGINWFSFKAYLWAVTTVSSRAFPYILVSKQLNNGFLLPVVDLLNHKNGAKVNWEFKDGKFFFRSSYTDVNDKSAELFNNYGDKSNIDLLFAYGFVIDNNEFDETTVSLKITESQLANAQTISSKLKNVELINKEAVNFTITKKDTLPGQLVDFFASLVQLSSEKNQYTLRMKLDGLNQLKNVVESKLNLFKNVKYADVSNQNGVLTTIRAYNNNQRKLFQYTLEEINKLEKSLIKEHKPLSFKAVIKQDRQFMNALLLTFGVATYQDLVDKNIVDQVFMLWILRVYNTGSISFVKKQFEDVKKSIVVTREDVLEYKDLYNFFFPSLNKKLPEVFKDSMDWSAKSFIIAGTVADRIGYTRGTSKELFVLDKVLVN